MGTDDSGRDLIDRFYRCRAGDDSTAYADVYAADAHLIRFDGTCSGVEEIAVFLDEQRALNGVYELRSIDQVTHSGDVLMWDATVDTTNGVLETTEVLVLDAAGRIRRHIPGIRGWWGM